MKSIDLTGQKFWKWTVIEKAPRPLTNSPSKPTYWKCKCECGIERIIPAHNLRCGRTHSCGCDNHTLPDYKCLYNKFVAIAKKTKTECALPFEKFVEFTKYEKCHYCHSPIRWARFGGRSGYNLDRKDNARGYFKDNCVACCSRCNFGKGGRFSYDEWYTMTECFRKGHP